MKLWMKKITVLLVTILTLGLYVPPIYLDAEADSDVNKGEIEPSEDRSLQTEQSDEDASLTRDDVIAPEDSNQLYLEELRKQAEEQVLVKLGEKISTKIDTDLDTSVLPNLQSVLDELFRAIGEEDSQFLMIAEDPSSGYGERIFNLYNAKEKKDVARFHVNRVQKPQDGFYFQFHYHLEHDRFEAHFPLAEIYWGKNTPPKWMS
ncbi:YpjP family protein [Gracilibacillus kekensis]|uniref:YpjP-like protein n=1 Tax=Gracilibacillus kekensis TaxID=1027249 RepID=A0A1M7QJ42_9BACI|nr:YpjP family protein [Gracilibacillus kekensis]SHN31008.1 YpjP-like protein [Gracilibacillus kekensis]